MNELSYLEKLLDGIDVEWLPLADVTKYEQPTKYLVKAKDYNDEFTTPVLTAGKTFILGYTDEYHGIYKASENPVIIFDDFTTANKWVDFDFKAKSSAMKMIKPSDNVKFSLKYIYYWLNTLPNELVEGDHKRKWISNYSHKKIPIPCPDTPEKSLAIQSEIVRILDTFTALTAELTAELNARKKQYNYYRDQLLSFEEGEVEWKAFGDVAIIQRGASPRPIAQYMTEDENGVPWIKIGDTSPGSKYIENTAQKVTKDGAKKSRILKPGDFVISNSMSFGRPYILKIAGAIHDGWASISGFEEQLDSDYLYHYLSSKNVQNYWGGKINSGSVSNLNADIIKTLPIPLPSKIKQRETAMLLDKFDTLTSSITEGLPREIELRRKQYEYYRDLLFSFPKPEAVTR
ncbi:restriction endonuclease subunit S [Salmonella enterica]|nr:restriction endonuclease subunit S [Salmonella enterica]